MPARDLSRAWFPEMTDLIRSEWQESIAMEELIGLTKRLNVMLEEIRGRRGIQPPMMFCQSCGTHHRAEPLRVSVRATVLAASQFEITDQQCAKDVEKRWKKYQQEHELDLYGFSAQDDGSGHASPQHDM